MSARHTPPHRELTLLLAGTAARRTATGERIVELAGLCDQRLLAEELTGQRLLAIGGARLQELGARLSPTLTAHIEAATTQGRLRSLLLERATADLVGVLEDADIRVLPIKGSGLAGRIYGDPGVRPTADIDVLVHPQDLTHAFSQLEALGYCPDPGSPTPPTTPVLHYALFSTDGRLPPVELHWRVHWYETAFSAGMLQRSQTDGTAGRRAAQPADELAALLLFYARDGFVGLRYAADIAAWWDTLGEELAPHPLDEVCESHPELRLALVTSAMQVSRLVGVPIHELFASPISLGRASRLALRLSNWTAEGDRDQLVSTQVLIDLLLSPSGGRGAFARRFLIPSSRSLVRYEHLPQDDRPPELWWRIKHVPKLASRFGYALWAVRGDRERAPLPSAVQDAAKRGAGGQDY